MPLDILPDPANANRHTARGQYMLDQSLRRVGAGRSIVAANDGTILAGNLTAEVAQERGIPFREIHTDGTELIVVVRDDLDPGSPRAKELALADNRSAEVSLDWDTFVLEQYKSDGVPVDLYWFDHEWDALLEADTGLYGEDEPDEAVSDDERVNLCFELDAATFNRWCAIRDELLAEGLADEGEVLKHVLVSYAEGGEA